MDIAGIRIQEIVTAGALYTLRGSRPAEGDPQKACKSWLSKKNVLGIHGRRWSYRTKGLDALARGGKPSDPMAGWRGATPRKLHFLMILTISGIRI